MARTPKPRSERKDEMIAAQIDAAMKRDMDELARQRDVPVAHLLREAIRQFLDSQTRAEA